MSKNKKLFAVIGLVLFALGIFGWFQELSGKPGATNLSDYAPWGLYIAFFLFFEAIAAGALFFGAARKSPKLLLIGIAAAIGTAVAIIPDLGAPLLMWHLLLSFNFSAPMLLDVWFLIFNIVFGVILLIGIKRGNEGLVKLFGILQMIVAVVLPIGTAWLFTTMPGKPGWASALEIGVFLCSAVLTGYLLVYFVLQDKTALTGILVSLGISILLLLGEMGQALYSTANAETAPMLAIMTGSYAWLFWAAFAGLMLLPLALGFFKKGGAIPLVALAGLGILVNKFLYVVKGNIMPLDRLGEGVIIPGMTTVNGMTVVTYYPSIHEWLVALGVIGFTVFVYCIISHLAKDDGIVELPKHAFTS